MIDFEGLFSSLPSPYMVLDRALNYVAVNRAYEDVVKLPASRLIGNNLFELFPNEEEDGRRLRQSLLSVLETGRSDTIAFIPYAMPLEDGTVEQRYWTAVHTPLKSPDGRVAFVLQNTFDVSELYRAETDADEDPANEKQGVHVLQRAREAERAYRGTLAQTDEFRRLFMQAPSMIAILEGEKHVFSFANASYRAFTGHRPLIGRSIQEVFPDITERGVIDRLDTVLRTGQPQSGEGLRILLKGEDEALREVFIDFHYQPIRSDEGAITGVFVQGTDRTAQYRTMQQQRLLLDELNHRVKNTLSTVQSIARRSFRSVDGSGFAAFEGRIKALSHVHDLISDRHWDNIRLDALLHHELAAFGAGRVSSSGPALDLTPKAAIAFAMLFHELASNGVKYGGLGEGDGALAVGWSVPTPASLVRFEWRETGRRKVPDDWQGSYGMRVLRRIVEGELGGSLALDLQPTGFICRFDVALEEVGRLVR